VNIQTDVVPSLHGGASLVVSESAWSLSSAFLHQALLHDLFIQTIQTEPARSVPPALFFPSPDMQGVESPPATPTQCRGAEADRSGLPVPSVSDPGLLRLLRRRACTI
jgi:hypothetical protein